MAAKCARFDGTHRSAAFREKAIGKMKIFRANNHDTDLLDQNQPEACRLEFTKRFEINSFYGSTGWLVRKAGFLQLTVIDHIDYFQSLICSIPRNGSHDSKNLSPFLREGTSLFLPIKD